MLKFANKWRKTMCFDWKKFGIIPVLAKSMDTESIIFGKTALQKYVYILQNIYGLDIGYDFEMYTYGPYCSELHNNLDLVEHWGSVFVGSSSDHGYIIRPGNDNALIEKTTNYYQQAEAVRAIESLIKDFGAFSARDLELRATIIYVDREYEYKKTELTNDLLCKTVSAIKPKFSLHYIQEAVDELNHKGFLKMCLREAC
jgi:uncharacterized protein